MAGITLAEATAKLAVWMAADTAVAAGQEYEIAGRRLKRSDAAEIRTNIEFWDVRCKQLSARAAGRSRARTVVVGF